MASNHRMVCDGWARQGLAGFPQVWDSGGGGGRARGPRMRRSLPRPFLGKIKETFLSWGAKQRDLQESVDLESALILTTWWKEIAEKGRDDRELLEKALGRVQKLSTQSQKKELQKNLNDQIIRLFTAINDVTTRASNIKMREVMPDTSRGQKEQWHSFDTLSEEHRKARQRVIHDCLQRDVGFTLRLGPSTIPTAGQGVFVKGRARIGAVVGIIPGTVWLPEHLQDADLVSSLFSDPDFMLTQRYDKVVIDGRRAADVISKAHADGVNLYALGHMINHGGLEKDGVNVQTVAYDFPQDPLGFTAFPEPLRPYIPNQYIKARTFLGSPDHSALVQSMVVVARRDLEDGEELFLNYRLNPKLGIGLPPWYRPVDVEEDMRRWA